MTKEELDKEAEKWAIGLTYPKFQDSQIANIVLRDVEDGFQKGAEFGYNKAKEEMQKNGLALQSDMDKTIKQNIALKAQIEKMKRLLEKWYKQHSDKTYTQTFYDELIKATEGFLWSDVCVK